MGQCSSQKVLRMAPSYTPIGDITRLVAESRAAAQAQRMFPLSARRTQLRALLKLVRDNEDAICEALHADLKRCKAENVLLECVSLQNDCINALAHLVFILEPAVILRMNGQIHLAQRVVDLSAMLRCLLRYPGDIAEIFSLHDLQNSFE